jgi:hypothetical protein
MVSKEKVPSSCRKRERRGAFRALNVILDAIIGLNPRDLEAESVADRGKSQTKAATESSKGKDKVDNPDWAHVPFHPIPITHLSSRPRFTQVVGSSCETPIVSPNPIVVASSSLAGRPVIGTAAAARMAMNPSGGGGPAGVVLLAVAVPHVAVPLAVAVPLVVVVVEPLPLCCRTRRLLRSTTCGTTPPRTWDDRKLSKWLLPVARQRSSLPQWRSTICVCRH